MHRGVSTCLDAPDVTCVQLHDGSERLLRHSPCAPQLDDSQAEVHAGASSVVHMATIDIA